MKYLIILLISFNSFASMHIPESMVGLNPMPTSYKKKSDCEKEYSEKCIKLTNDYNQETAMLAPKMIDDPEKPIKECEGLDAIIDFFGFDENGCKIIGYEQVDSGEKIIVEDAAKKEKYKARVAQEKAQKEAISKEISNQEFGQRLYAEIKVFNKSKGLNKNQRRQLRNQLKELKELMLDGDIELLQESLESVEINESLFTQDEVNYVKLKVSEHLSLK